MSKTYRLIRRPEVLKKGGFSASTLRNLENSGDFPRHTLITPRCAVWVEEQVDEWLRARLANPAKPAAVPHRRVRSAVAGGSA